eukprot:scaffold4790_cov98-Cylindrotheca_fusiformis.AAC.13
MERAMGSSPTFLELQLKHSRTVENGQPDSGTVENGEGGELAFKTTNALSHFSRSSSMMASELIILLRYHCNCRKSDPPYLS